VEPIRRHLAQFDDAEHSRNTLRAYHHHHTSCSGITGPVRSAARLAWPGFWPIGARRLLAQSGDAT
jgi:hypothetical protein